MASNDHSALRIFCTWLMLVALMLMLSAYIWSIAGPVHADTLAERLGTVTDQIHALPLGATRDALILEHAQLTEEMQARIDGRCTGPHHVTRETNTCPCGLDDRTFEAVTNMLLKDCGGCRVEEVWDAPPGPPCHGRLVGISAPMPIRNERSQ